MRRVWSIVKSLLLSGLIGTGIGMIWYACELVHDVGFQNVNIESSNFLFWLLASFLIGLFFNLAGWIFSNDNWSLRKQIVINFFVCFTAWFLFEMAQYNFRLDGIAVIQVIISFLIMYFLAYGSYLLSLRHDIKQINQKLKESRK